MAQDSVSPRCPSPFWSATVVFLVALALRIDFLLEFTAVPLFHIPIMDMAYHDQWARDIVAGRGAEYMPFFRAPLYAYALAGVYAMLGDGPWAIRIVQVILGSLSLFTGLILHSVRGLLLAIVRPGTHDVT